MATTVMSTVTETEVTTATVVSSCESVLAKVGSFATDSSPTQVVTDVGFQPKLVLLWWNGGTGEEISEGNYCIGFGAAISDSSRFCVQGMSDDGYILGRSSYSAYDTDCFRYYPDADTLTGPYILDFSSMDADGFTLVWDGASISGIKIYYLVLGGDALTDVYIGTQTVPGTNGNYDVSAVGFQPDAVIFASSVGTINSISSSMSLVLGMATGASEQGVVNIISSPNEIGTYTQGYGHNDECHADMYDSFWQRLVSFNSDGFTMYSYGGIGLSNYFYIALKGGQYYVGDLNTRADNIPFVEIVGFSPSAILFASVNRFMGGQGVPTIDARMSIGAGTSESERVCVAISDESNLAVSETAFACYDTAVYAHVKDDAIVGLMDIDSIDADGFTCVMDDEDPAQLWVTYLAIG